VAIPAGWLDVVDIDSEGAQMSGLQRPGQCGVIQQRVDE
jgi:hypothetical protein